MGARIGWYRTTVIVSIVIAALTVTIAPTINLFQSNGNGRRALCLKNGMSRPKMETSREWCRITVIVSFIIKTMAALTVTIPPTINLFFNPIAMAGGPFVLRMT
jgi:hypothetical protein